MRIVALVRSLDHVCCRYRLAAYRPCLEQAGYQFEIYPWPRFFLSLRLLRWQIGRPDILIMQRRMPSVWQLNLLKQLAGNLLYDFDDALFLRPSFSPHGTHCSRLANKFCRTVQMVDGVVAGNHFLAHQAALWKTPDDIHVIPTCLDVRRYSPAQHSKKSSTQLVWIGSSSTLLGLKQLIPTLECLGEQTKDFNLKIICDSFFSLQNLPVIAARWSTGTEAHELAQADIGISWMPDDLWSQGKCGLKVLQYMAAGLPVVANAVGVVNEIIVHGETGFLARSPEEFLQRVHELANDRQLRQRMGQAGRIRVEQEFNLPVAAQRWLDVLQRSKQSDSLLLDGRWTS